MNVLDKAIKFATEAHSGAFRKGTKIPYIVHPLEAAAIAATMTVDEEVIAAAVLHDIIEDTPVTKEQLIAEFNSRIAELVCADSENKREYKPASETWEIRKQETLDYIPNASRDEQIIILSDKLSNMRSLCRDYEEFGDFIWNKFNMKDKTKQAWYYGGITWRLNKVNDTHAYWEYRRLVDKLFDDCESTKNKSKVKNWYDDEIDQFRRQLDNDFDDSKDEAQRTRNPEFRDAIFYGKPKTNAIKIHHYSWLENSVYRYYDKAYVNNEIENSILILIENEFFKWDEKYIKDALRKSIKIVPYDGELPSCSEWEDKSEFEQKALEALLQIVKSETILNIVEALNAVQKKLCQAKLFENKKDVQIYERLKYELTECSIKEFEALKQEATK